MKTVCAVKHGDCPLTKAMGEYDERLKRTTIVCSHCGTSFLLLDAHRREQIPGAVYDVEMQAWVQESAVGRGDG